MLNDRKVIAVNCQSKFVLGILDRMLQPLAERGWTLVCVTTMLSVCWRARRKGIHCLLVKDGKPRYSYSGLDVKNTKEFLLNHSDEEKLNRFQSSVLSTLENLSKKEWPSAVIVWNGMDACNQAILAFAKRNGVPTVFFELGNIDSKLFVDPEGVNAASRVARYPEILDRWKISEEEFLDWLNSFQLRQLKTSAPPQARTSRTINYFYPLDRVGMALWRIPQPFIMPLYKKIFSKLQTHQIMVAPAIKPELPYVFLPLQVSADTNLILLSDCDNIKAIEIAERHAKKLACVLVVKTHPAETNQGIIRNITSICKERGHLLTSLNTTELIRGAMGVVTINSTVGLEAMLYGKEVKILGRSIYSGFSDNQARAYVLRYLVDFNPFGTSTMTLAALDRILKFLGESKNERVPPLDHISQHS